MNEIIVFLIILIIISPLFGYYAFLAWFRPEKFRAMGQKSLPLYGNSPLMKSWISSKAYMWMARFTALIVFMACGTLLFAMLTTIVISSLAN
jgi:hypothetical protein